MTDDRELAGLDPFALLDNEAGRLDAFLSGLGGSGWKRASRCAGWTVRDVLGHLAAGEDYHRACLDGTVPAFLAGFAERGGTDLDSVNALGVAGQPSVDGVGLLGCPMAAQCLTKTPESGGSAWCSGAARLAAGSASAWRG
jgi:Mycothiol maleylpyruvate isomerase N-terminal domain